MTAKPTLTMFAVVALLICFPASAKTPAPPVSVTAVSEDPTYAYKESNPVKVGDWANGPQRERDYFGRLRGPNGEPVRYERDGSCCGFDTPNGPFGGMLDIYSVWINTSSESVKIYINMYDYEQPMAPMGFTFVHP